MIASPKKAAPWSLSAWFSGSSGTRSRASLSFNLEKFKNSSTLKFQSLLANMIANMFAEIGAILSIFCRSSFEVCVTVISGAPKTCTNTIGSISKCSSLSSQNTLQNRQSCPLTKTHDSPSFAERLNMLKRLGGGVEIGNSTHYQGSFTML